MLAIMPELDIQQLEINQEGLINDVLIVNRQLVFRFTKTDEFVQILEKEMRVLDFVRARVGVQVPTPIYQSADCVVYPYLAGQPLLRDTILSSGESQQMEIAQQLGRFLYGLHTTNITEVGWQIPNTQAPVTREKWESLRQRVREKVYPLLLKHQVDWAENLFEGILGKPGSFDYTPVLIHGDLAPYHILFDEVQKKISGVIDFGVAGVGDGALDIGNLITSYGESFVRKMREGYPDLERYLPRARFYAQSIELEWVLLGIERGESFWFTAHIGGARDIWR